MDNLFIGKKILNIIIIVMFFVTGCNPTTAPSTRSTSSSIGKGSTSNGNGATGTGTIDTSNSSITPKIEIRHLIEPNLSTDSTYRTGTGIAGGGSYVRKLTIPKNFAGRLYVAGINVGTLSNQFVKVRFKFGVGREPVTIPATVTQAPGITPQTGIDVLVLDLRAEPFRSIRLPYDLYDYKEYDFANGDTPVQNNRDTDLYCRGLRLEDDPTFQGVGACDADGEECLYAYAKIKDQGLLKETVTSSGTVLVPISPTLPQVKSVSGSNYYQDYLSQQLKKALPDSLSVPFKFSEVAVPANSTDSINANFLSILSSGDYDWSAISLNGANYYYRGPYRLVNMNDWQFKFSIDKLTGANRLFKLNSFIPYNNYLSRPLPDDSQSNPVQNKIFFNSYLFPLATKLSLNSGVSHLSSPSVESSRSERVLTTSGNTEWMDGANIRAQSVNSDLEHIGSCNISSSIEIIARDNNDVEYVVSTANDVKLQLVRPTQIYTDSGNEVLYTNFKTCTSNASCGGSECCFNNRCWDSSLVSQCIDTSLSQGNRNIGEGCTTDLQCSSLCCNRTSGLCAPHNTLLSPAVLCSKPVGDFCIAKEWCQKSPVTKCLIVKTGTDSLGNVTCRQQCYTTQEYGDCKNAVCVPPVQPAITTFDPTAEGACNNAVQAPSF